MAIAIARTSMRRRKISPGERWCWRRLWRHSPADTSLDVYAYRRSSILYPLSLRIDRRRGLSNPGIARLDSRVNEIAALVIRQESALHRIDGDLLEIIDGQPKCIGRCFEFLSHARAAHQPVVGVEGDAKFLLIKNSERMFGQAGRGAGMDVADKANLQRDSFIE